MQISTNIILEYKNTSILDRSILGIDFVSTATNLMPSADLFGEAKRNRERTCSLMKLSHQGAQA